MSKEKFEFKSPAELEKMTPEEVNAYAIAKQQHEEEKEKAFEKRISDIVASVEETNKTVIEIKETAFNQQKAENVLAKYLNDNAEKIKKIHKEGSGVLTIEVKAVGTITTANGNVPDYPDTLGIEQTGLTSVNFRKPTIENLVTRFRTNQPSYAYSDALPKEGDFAIVPEGGLKPQLDLTWQTEYARPIKIAGWMKLTDEAVQDIPGLEDVARNYLKQKHDLKKENIIMFDPTYGATVLASQFTAGALANTVATPNIMDVVNAIITGVYMTPNFVDEAPFMPNLVMMSPIDFFINFVAAKDDQGRPLYPQASMFNVVVIGNATIMPNITIPVGKIFVGDMKKYNITDYTSYTVQIGWVNDDFIRNQFVMLGESRFHAFIKTHDLRAFIYDDIATVKTAITAA